MELLIKKLAEDRTHSNLQLVVNSGVIPKVLKNNEWRPHLGEFNNLNQWNHIIPLYDKMNGVFVVTAVGFY